MIYNIYTYNLIYVYVCIYIHTIIYHIVWYVCIKPHSDPGTSFWPWPFRSFLGPDPCPELLAVKEFRSWCQKKWKWCFFWMNETMVQAILMFTKVLWQLWLGSRPETCLNDCIQGTSSPTGDACLWRRDGTGRPGDRDGSLGMSGPQVLATRWFGDLVLSWRIVIGSKKA